MRETMIYRVVFCLTSQQTVLRRTTTMFIEKALFLFGLMTLCHSQCTNQNCALPNCRCFNDGRIPGGLNRSETPQIVLITGDYQLNSEYDEDDQKLFTVKNPNDCPITGTFFLQDSGTEYNIVKKYYDAKFEIGIQSDNGQMPTTQKEWDDMITSKEIFPLHFQTK